ncbi:hypothetical protein [Desulfovulcanus sp.]
MELYQRIEAIIERFDLSNAAFASMVGIKPSTFNGYLNDKGQEKIRVSHLNRILEAFPKIRKEWLFFGEGPMLKSEDTIQEEQGSYQAETQVSELSSDYLAQAHLVEVVTRKLKEANATDEVIQKAILAIVMPGEKVEEEKTEKSQNCA